jgi:hypothetical protein
LRKPTAFFDFALFVCSLVVFKHNCGDLSLFCRFGYGKKDFFDVLNTIFNKERKLIFDSVLCDVCGVTSFTKIDLYLQ